MSNSYKSQEEILKKLDIPRLNNMQVEAIATIRKNPEVLLLSPTGTGKTLAFLLPILKNLQQDLNEVQALILVPSRELAIQIEQVMRNMGSGFKVNAVYGGRSGSKDRVELNHKPAVLVGTPGRVSDHLKRGVISPRFIQTLVLDEFDKSLEVGFEIEMRKIVRLLTNVDKKVLTSATRGVKIPDFVGLSDPIVINYLQEKRSSLALKKVISPSKDKLETLVQLLGHIGEKNGIVFCNFKDSIQRVSDFLSENGVSHGVFYGGIEQVDRERALIQFRNGTHRLLLATDLAARGIDVPELDFIIHYHLPLKADEFTHRNGRTARMNTEGLAYVIKAKTEELPYFIGAIDEEELQDKKLPQATQWKTLFITGGRRDKISKGDIAGLFMKQGGLEKNQLGMIELKTDSAFVAVQNNQVKALLPKVNNARLKTKKVRITVL